jgi:uncharacterized ferredoxin-like protein
MEQQSRRTAIEAAARQILTAARTAPKARGRDTLALAAVYDDTIITIAEKMEELGTRHDMAFFLRDAESLRRSDALLLLGTAIASAGLAHCGLCGLGHCAGKGDYPEVPCVMNTADLGIALGAAATAAARLCVDARIMFSAGKAVTALGLLGETVKIAFALPLSCSSKSPFFDR